MKPNFRFERTITYDKQTVRLIIYRASRKWIYFTHGAIHVPAGYIHGKAEQAIRKYEKA